MAKATTVAAYILKQKGPMSAMKLQKLVFYAQAWALVWDEKPLFNERVEAWANGPVVPELYRIHAGKFELKSSDFISLPGEGLEENERGTIDAVIAAYGDMTAQSLSDRTHSESPWERARKGLAPGERGSAEISLAEMHEFYSGIDK